MKGISIITKSLLVLFPILDERKNPNDVIRDFFLSTVSMKVSVFNYISYIGQFMRMPDPILKPPVAATEIDCSAL